MTFLAEWGDRSQLATIALASSYNVYLVTLGALLGHLICTAGAVQVGNWISNKIKIRTVLLVGGIVFILSGFTTLFLLF